MRVEGPFPERAEDGCAIPLNSLLLTRSKKARVRTIDSISRS
jgi:hypothetical protein